jgi:hypothetical protein
MSDETTAARPLNINKLVDQYVQLRDKKRALELQHKEQLRPYSTVMEEIESLLLGHMQSAGIDSVATPGGTAYQITKLSATIRDGSAFREWVVTNQQFDIVDWRANAKAVFGYIKSNEGNVPPGVNASSYVTLGFRRPSDKE